MHGVVLKNWKFKIKKRNRGDDASIYRAEDQDEAYEQLMEQGTMHLRSKLKRNNRRSRKNQRKDTPEELPDTEFEQLPE